MAVHADLKGGSAVTSAECHTCRGSSPTSKKTKAPAERFLDALWRDQFAAKQYATAPEHDARVQLGQMCARSGHMPLPMLVVVNDEFSTE